MGWKTEHKDQSRQKITASAAELFTKRGFDNVTINDVMEHAGLTRGAFYNHFQSKSDLYAEAVVDAAQRAKNYALENPNLKPSDIIELYLSEQHRQGEFACPLAFLATDMRQRESKVRSTYTEVFKKFVTRIQELTGDTEDELEAIKKTVLMVGGMAIAQAINDDELVEKLLKACREGVNAGTSD